MSDVRVVDRLILRGRQEYQETMNCWKQEPHIMGLLLRVKERPKESFLDKFYKVRGFLLVEGRAGVFLAFRCLRKR